MSTPVAVNPYLEGNFAPIAQEITADELQIIGTLPPELSGMFVRNGPNPQFSPLGRYHWFDGDGMLHGVQINNGKASYLNRYIQTRGFKLEQEAGKSIWTGLLEPPQMDNPYGPSKNTANTALVWQAGKLLALWEGGKPHAIRVPSLETIGTDNYDGKLVSPFTAHPKVDPVTGEMMFFGYSLAEPPYLKYSVVSPTGELLKTVTIDLPVGVMMHDFAITADYTIFMDLPLTFRPERAQQGEAVFQFEVNRPSRFGILPRHGDNNDIRWFETSSCYIFHTLNAYSEGEEVVLIACRMSSTSVLGTPEFDDPQADIPRLHQWRFHLGTGLVRETSLEEMPSEFPRLNEQYLGRKTRYGYSSRMAGSELPLFDGIIKHDFSLNQSQTHEFGSGHYGGEAFFVPRPNAETEDDGWLVTFLHDENSQTSELVIISAQNLTSEPIARVIIPQRVPYGFHCLWLSQAQLNNK
ncbi:MAG: 9-cis-epoxycarotenoid dioxygenase [Symploca sp. SIO3C6]|nr:9-cis-epoxycarotenoid dioxygenase [Symploca sp. SIO3C6]